jgi:signal transduction histidine kinase
VGAPPDPDLDELTALVGRCLGRIDEQAFRIQELGDPDERVFLVADLLENEAAELQDLLTSLLAATQAATDTDINAIVDRVVAACLHELDVPIVLRQRLADRLPPVACPPAVLTHALQRALVLAADRLPPGGELTVTTREDDGRVLVEIASDGADGDGQLASRAETLREFVDAFGGLCRIDSDRDGSLCVALELPRVMTAGER